MSLFAGRSASPSSCCVVARSRRATEHSRQGYSLFHKRSISRWPLGHGSQGKPRANARRLITKIEQLSCPGTSENGLDESDEEGLERDLEGGNGIQRMLIERRFEMSECEFRRLLGCDIWWTADRS